MQYIILLLLLTWIDVVVLALPPFLSFPLLFPIAVQWNQSFYVAQCFFPSRPFYNVQSIKRNVYSNGRIADTSMKVVSNIWVEKSTIVTKILSKIKCATVNLWSYYVHYYCLERQGKITVIFSTSIWPVILHGSFRRVLSKKIMPGHTYGKAKTRFSK